MGYRRIFSPPTVQVLPRAPGDRGVRVDRRDGSVYVYTEEIVLAVNVAIATGRPLLIHGPTGSGKSSLAHNVARTMDWRYYEQVITTRTQARDLLWTFDTVRRLSEAYGSGTLPAASRYIVPGVLWWAFDPKSARVQGVPPEETGEFGAQSTPQMDTKRAVVLLDEIDKADPDMPNNLLVPLGSLEFTVDETKTPVKVARAKPPLVLITTNEERELPGPFLRRCVTVTLPPPDRDRLLQIAAAHFGPGRKSLAEAVADRFLKLVDGGGGSTAEYLDAIQACVELKINPGDQDWQAVESAILGKPVAAASAVMS